MLPLEVQNSKKWRAFAEHNFKCYICELRGCYIIKRLLPIFNAKKKRGRIKYSLHTVHFQLMTIDHVIPKSQGGENEVENMRPCCKKCNSSKSDLPLLVYLIKTKRFNIMGVDHTLTPDYHYDIGGEG